MMGKIRIGTALFILANLTVTAGTIPGRWEKVEALQPGSAIQVQMKSGNVVKAAFVGSAPDSLTLNDEEKHSLNVPKSEVQRITTRAADSTRNGTLIGLALGFAAGVAVGYAAYLQDSGDSGPFSDPRVYVFLGGLPGAGAGALIGYMADKSHKGEDVLYEATK